MKQSDDFIFCKNFINDFISKYLKGNIQALLDFDFASLRQDKQFGCNSRGFDCDEHEFNTSYLFFAVGAIHTPISHYPILVRVKSIGGIR